MDIRYHLSHLPRLARPWRLVLVVVLLASVFPPQAAHAAANWTTVSSLNVARAAHTATLLRSGKVLIVGGRQTAGVSTASAEVYDPGANTWTPVAPLNTPRTYHTATLLPSGKVLVAGGGPDYTCIASAEVYDPDADTWTTVASMNTARCMYTATLLPNGKVFVVGGATGAPKSAEVYDPSADTWTPTASALYNYNRHTATLLRSGKVLVAGGKDDSLYSSWGATATYNPAYNSWGNNWYMPTESREHTATLLPSGKVLAAGGYPDYGSSYPVTSTAVYEEALVPPWTAAAPLNFARYGHTATLLPTGWVLVAGGRGNSSYGLASAEVYDPSANTWTLTASLNTARGSHTATLLQNGKVLVVGGWDADGLLTLASAEVYDLGFDFHVFLPLARR